MPTRAACLLLCLSLLPATGPATATDSAESLRFAIRWLFVPAGTAVLQQQPLADDRIRFRAETCSNRTIDLFYKVRDRITADGRREAQGYRAERYDFHLREGRHKADQVADFTTPGKVRFHDLQKNTEETFDIPVGTVDVLTAFFVTRELPLEVGREYRIPVFDKRKSYDVVVEVLRRESRDTILGRVDTVVIRPRMETEGIFKRTGDIYIWLTDDERHIPVYMESEVKIGRVIAELVERADSVPAGNSGRLACES